MPAWLAGIVAPRVPLEHARRFGIDPALFSLTRLAALARQRGVELGLFGHADLHAEEAAVGLRLLADLEACEPGHDDSHLPHWTDPHEQPLLRELLALAVENRRLRDRPRLARLEGELDGLHDALADQVRGEAERLRSAKLSGLAEFAAGASHEINNPLAVISGQAQYILGHEADWLAADAGGRAKKSLQTIIHQAKHPHHPPRPDAVRPPGAAAPGWLDLPTLLGEVAASLEDDRHATAGAGRDRRQAGAAGGAGLTRTSALGLKRLLRNALVPPRRTVLGGWLVEPGPADRVEVFVEDSGPGPAPEQRPHLFDPFYSAAAPAAAAALAYPWPGG
ncbi:MAG: HAMP domain-containing sensor histidine kinase [Gemmataceae bacterium]